MTVTEAPVVTQGPVAIQRFIATRAYAPLTERLVHRVGSRAATVGFFALLPVVQFVAFAAVATAAGVPLKGNDELTNAIPVRLVNMYIVVLAFWAARRITRQLTAVQSAAICGPDAPATWWTWLLPPLVLSVGFAVVNEVGHAFTYGSDVMAAHPLPFVITSVLTFLTRIPTTAAFWTAVIALIATARIGRIGTLGMFPEDRSLGLRPVGLLVFQVVLLLGAAFAPLFALSNRPADFVSLGAAFVVALAAVGLATWELHLRMVTTRQAAVAAARSRYAPAYRAALAQPDSKEAGDRLSTAEALLRGAESIHEWPFDERTQRLVAIVLTGVATGVIVRVVVFVLGV